MKLHFMLLLLLPVLSIGQISKSTLLAEINKDIWIPFLKGVNANDAGLYNAVNSNDYYWVLAGNKTRIMNQVEYVKDAKTVMDGRIAKGIRTELDIRFLERNINNEFSSEKCVIKYTLIEPEKPPISSFGIIQVFSRKESGVWKRLVQYNYTDSVSASTFEKAIRLDSID